MPELFVLAIQLGTPLVLLIVGFNAGTWVEKRHYRSIEERERLYVGLENHSLEELLPGQVAEESALVVGSAVISVDYFKRFVAALRNIFGGRVSSYESLLDRARREAILRLKEEALGYDLIMNLRVETAAIGGNSTERKQLGSIEAYAYATAVKLRPGP